MGNNNQKGIQKTIYLDKEALGVMRKMMSEEKRSLSEIINANLRKSLNLPIRKDEKK